MKRDTKKAFLRLKELSGQAGPHIYERVSIAFKVLDDHDWIIEIHHGDDGLAREAVQDEYFRDLGKLISLDSLLNILREFPTEEEWAEYRYDLGAMKALYDERRETTKPRQQRQTATIQELHEAQDKIEALQRTIRKQRTRIKELESEVTALRQQVEV